MRGDLCKACGCKEVGKEPRAIGRWRNAGECRDAAPMDGIDRAGSVGSGVRKCHSVQKRACREAARRETEGQEI